MLTFWWSSCTGHPDTDFHCEVSNDPVGIILDVVNPADYGPQTFIIGQPQTLHGHVGVTYISVALPGNFNADKHAIRMSTPKEPMSTSGLSWAITMSQVASACPTWSGFIASSFGNTIDFEAFDRLVHTVTQITSNPSPSHLVALRERGWG